MLSVVPGYDLVPAAQVQFSKDVRDVCLDRLGRDNEQVGDLAVGQTSCHEPRDFVFPWGQSVVVHVARPRPINSRPNTPGRIPQLPGANAAERTARDSVSLLRHRLTSGAGLTLIEVRNIITGLANGLGELPAVRAVRNAVPELPQARCSCFEDGLMAVGGAAYSPRSQHFIEMPLDAVKVRLAHLVDGVFVWRVHHTESRVIAI